MLSLAIEKRIGDIGSAKSTLLRKAGKIPAIFYGPKVDATPIVINAKEFMKTLKKAGESSVIVIKDGAVEHEALIRDVDYHPVNGEPRHVDFYVIEKGKKVQVEVPLVFAGVSPAVKDKAGILVKVLRTLNIEAAPRDLPRELSVDISKLIELNDTIHVKDIDLPTGVISITDAGEVVASVSEAKEEVVEAPTAIDMSSIEVEAKGKEPKEGEAGTPDVKPAPETK